MFSVDVNESLVKITTPSAPNSCLTLTLMDATAADQLAERLKLAAKQARENAEREERHLNDLYHR